MGLFAMQQLRKGQFVELNSILDLVLLQSSALSRLFEKAVPGRARFISSNKRLNKYCPFIRCKSKRQIGSLIVAGQNSIKPCIELIGANGMQRGGVGLFTTTIDTLAYTMCGPQLFVVAVTFGWAPASDMRSQEAHLYIC